MRLVVGYSKKVGLPGYSSAGATCQVEFGDVPVAPRSEAFVRRVRRAFDACRAAVEDELAGRPAAAGSGAEGAGSAAAPAAATPRPATANQLSALRALAARSRLPCGAVDAALGGKALTALSAAEASAAIARLRAARGAPTGNGHLAGGT